MLECDHKKKKIDISDSKNLNIDNIDLENALSLAENLVWGINLNLSESESCSVVSNSLWPHGL